MSQAYPRRFAGWLLAAGLAAAPAVGQPPDKCGKVEVSGRPGAKAAVGKAAGSTLAATTVEDVVFTIKLRKAISGDHVVTLKVYMPEGNLYQSLGTPVSLTGSQRRGKRPVPGYPFPLDIQMAMPITTGSDSDKQLVEVTMPLAGTAIVSNSIYGDWKVDLYLDDAQQACADRVSFRIGP